MSKLPKHLRILGFVAALAVSASAFGAPRGDDAPALNFASRVKAFVVKILDDIRGNFPGG